MSGLDHVQRLRDRYLTYKHLPPSLQEMSRPVCELVEVLVSQALKFEDVDWDEFAAGVRKLIEAKDAIVRSVVSGRNVTVLPTGERG